MGEGHLVEVVALDLEVAGDVVADEEEPRALLVGEAATVVLLAGKPVLEAGFDVLREGDERILLAEGEADQGHDVGEGRSTGTAHLG